MTVVFQSVEAAREYRRLTPNRFSRDDDPVALRQDGLDAGQET
jgi:hypothetical protein